MRKIGKLLVGTVLAGAIATGIAASPASAATATTAGATTVASTASQSFSQSWTYFNTGGNDGRIGYRWGRQSGKYWLDFKLWDRDQHDRGFTYFDVYYKRDGRWYHYNRFSTKSFSSKRIVFGHDVEDFRIRGGYGWNGNYGWGGYHYSR